MNDYLVKAIDKTKTLRLLTISAKNLVSTAQVKHQTAPTASAVLGRTLIGSTLLAAAQLVEGDELTVRLMGDGPAGAVIVTAKSDLTVKGYMQNPQVNLPLKSNGHLDVAKAVGHGELQVTKDLGLKQPYTGEVPLISGEIAEDFTYYLAQSEQIPASVGLSVFVNPNQTIGAAGGFMLQALPGASDKTLEQVTQRIKDLPALSELLTANETPEQLAKRILGDDAKIFDPEEVAFKCDCAKEKYADILETLPTKQLKEMIDDGQAELVCHFCQNQYSFTADELQAILAKKAEDQEY